MAFGDGKGGKMIVKRNWLVRAGVAAMLVAYPAMGSAASLQDALVSAYATNPDIRAQRAVVRQIDEEVPQAKSGAYPSISATLSRRQDGIDFNDNGLTTAAQLSVQQALYRGGRTRSAIDAADARVLAARARLRQTENTILAQVVTAYADVLRYQAVVELNQNQVKVFDTQLKASRDRFEVGDLTRTDVAQSESSRANALSNLVAAQGLLSNAREAFRRIVGVSPDSLEPLPALPPLPGTVGQANDLAAQNSPSLIAARYDEQASRYDVRTIEGERLPTIGVQGGLGYTESVFPGGSGGGTTVTRGGTFFTQSIGIQATIPLYQAGQVGSRIRQAQERRSQLMESIASAERTATESSTNAIVSLQTARSLIAALQVAVDANALALEGTRQENQVGSRTVLDVLDAEQLLLNTRVNLVTAKRDEYVAAYNLLAATGQAEAAVLSLPVERYDSTANLKRVRGKWFDFDTNPNPKALPKPSPASASGSVPPVKP